jgi:polyisoprenoid-binding protein YceI
MTMLCERSAPGITAPDRVPSSRIGTWTVDPSHSSISLAWRKHRLWTITGRLHSSGVIHPDALPPVGVIQFDQRSGLPVLTLALDPASVEPHHTDLNAMLGGPDVDGVRRHRWWTLRSQSLEILPTGAWRVMARFTANGTPGLVELHLEVDRGPSEPDGLVLRGRGVLDRRGFGIAGPVSALTPQIRLDLALRARRVEDPHPHREERGSTCTTSMPG